LSELTLDCKLRARQETWYIPRTKESSLSWKLRKSSSAGEQNLHFGYRRRFRVSAVSRAILADDAFGKNLFAENRFRTLAQAWKRETTFASTANRMFLLQSYQQIIGLGPSAVPLILRDLELEPNHWYWALAAITGENPVKPQEAGNIRAMRAAWLNWGRTKGLI